MPALAETPPAARFLDAMTHRTDSPQPHRHRPSAAVVLALCAVAPLTLLLPSGCTGTASTLPAPQAGTPSAAVFAAGEIRSVTPWNFGEHDGRIISTDNFAIYTTETTPAIIDRVPRFLEQALTAYRTSLTGDSPLPPPPGRMESFVMGSRQQWKDITLSVLGNQGRDMLNITAGGFAVGGRAFLFDIGIGSTFYVASHEGWHQYTQRTFAEPMPVFIEEGIATYMEGHRWQDQSVAFMPWANLERFDQLRTAFAGGRLKSVRELIETSPQRLIQEPGDAAVTYYAQLWALVHFLREGDGGTYRPALQRLLTDAQVGRLSQSVAGALSMNERAGLLARRQGIAVFRAYFDRDPDAFDRRYQAFIQQLVRSGARDAISQGRSPIPVAAVPRSSSDSPARGGNTANARSAISVASPLLGDRAAIPSRGVRRTSIPVQPAPSN